MTGLTIGIIGLALCAILCGIGSGLGLRATGSAATGVMAEDPSKFSKVIVLALLPIMSQGWNVFWAVMPMAIGGAVSAYLQGKTAAAAIMGVGKKGEIGSKALIFPAMIEFYALLGLVVSILLLGNVPVSNVSQIVVPVIPAP